MSTRRDFMQAVGIAVATLVTARCARGGGIGLRRRAGSPQERIRECWRQLDQVAKDARRSDGDPIRAVEELVVRYRAALDELVTAGEVDEQVADHAQMAFAEAALHVRNMNAPITCYLPTVLGGVWGRTLEELVAQAQMLEELRKRGDIPDETVALAQQAVERDIAFLEVVSALAGLEPVVRDEAHAELARQVEGEGIEASPEAEAAAQFLVALLLGEDG